MKIISYTLSLCAAMFLLSSCDGFLGLKPKGKVIPETTEDYEQLLNYEQIQKTSEIYPNFMTDDAFVPEKDPLIGGVKGLKVPLLRLYRFDKETFGESEEDRLWAFSYNRIYTYNVVIEDIMGTSEGTQQKKMEIKAEALLGRALEYLTLVNMYANHYDPAKANTDPGVPLVLDKGIEKTNLKRASVQEVYDRIEQDLVEALKSLPERPVGNAFRASKSAGHGLLARMYLYKGDYASALKNAKLALEKHPELLDLKRYEVINPKRFAGRNNVPELTANPENIYIRMAPRAYGLTAQIYGSEYLVNMYDKQKDKRFLIYFARKISNLSLDHDLWVPYVRVNLAVTTPEMYLIAAEAEARLGAKDEALRYLNHLRDHRILEHTPLVASTSDEALKLVLDERRRELPFTGCIRLIDLKRLNRDPRFAKTVTHIVADETYTIEPNDPKYILPIPPIVLQFNPDMVPNKR